VAVISVDGSVTGISPGQTVIAAVASNGVRGQATVAVPVPVVSSVVVTPIAPQILVGSAFQLMATARTAAGATVPGRTFVWSTSAPSVLSVTADGVINALAVGSASITARDQASGVSGSLVLSVVAPIRPPGSLLTFGTDSVLQFESWSYVNTLVAVDTARNGKDHRLGIVRLPGVPFIFPISRSDFPQMSAITECSNGEVYATSYSTSSSSVGLWRVSPVTTNVTFVTDLSFIPGVATSMACDSPTRLFIADYFGGFANLYAVNATALTYQAVGGVAENGDTYLGLAYSPSGVLYATTQNRLTTVAPYPQFLVTVNVLNGTRTPVGTNQVRQLPLVSELAFRGVRLMGLTPSKQLTEISTTTGVVTVIRTATMP
jgi:hypothetical protein